MSVTLSDIALNSTHLSGNRIWVKATSSGAPAGSTNYKILLKIVSADNVLFGGPFVDAIAPDASGVAWFDISGYVNQPISISFNWPQDGRFKAYPDMTYDIWLYPGESYIDSNGDLQESFGSVVEPFFIIPGKLGEEEIAAYNDASTNWFDAWCGVGKFLTRQPDTMVVHPKQPVKLWLKWPSGTGATLTLTTIGYYDDGTSETITQEPAVSRASIYEMNLQPELMGFALEKIDGSRLMYYTHQWTGGGLTSPLKRFDLDWSYNEFCSFLFFLNPIGGIDCIWLSGGEQPGHTTTAVSSKMSQAKGASVKQHTVFVHKSTQPTWKINTGYKSREEITALIDLFKSEYVWLLHNAHNPSTAKLYPVIIQNSENILAEWDSDVHNLELDIIMAH